MSIRPKIILVKNVLSPAECDALITEAEGKGRFVPSPEQHYSDDDQFKNYRTSVTAWVGDLAPALQARRRARQLALLPALEYAEQLQVVRYNHNGQ